MGPRLAVTLILVLGLAALGSATDGFRVVTSEGARRLSVERAPRVLPVVELTDHQGRHFRWSTLRGQPVLVEFIFTTCPNVCQKMTSDFGALARRLDEGSPSPVRLLSISFDRERDTVDQLRRVAESYGADGERWRFVRISDASELEQTLEAFGVVAIPSDAFGFEHNAAIHAVRADGKLARIADIDQLEQIEEWATRGPS